MTRREAAIVAEPTGFDDDTLEEVLASYLYTSEGMFGEVVFDAHRELYKRIPPPDWCFGADGKPKSGGLPTLAKEFYNNDGTVKVK